MGAIHIAKFGDDEVENVRLAHLSISFSNLKKDENSADVAGEPVDVADEMLSDVMRVALQVL